MSTAANLIKDFGIKLGFSQPLLFNEKNQIRINVDKNIDIDIEQTPTGDALHIFCVLDQIPPEHLALLASDMLQANFFGQGTHGNTLCIDPATHELILFKTIATPYAGVDQLIASLEALVESAAEWRQRLEGAPAALSSNAAPSDSINLQWMNSRA